MQNDHEKTSHENKIKNIISVSAEAQRKSSAKKVDGMVEEGEGHATQSYHGSHFSI